MNSFHYHLGIARVGSNPAVSELFGQLIGLRERRVSERIGTQTYGNIEEIWMREAFMYILVTQL